MTSCVTWLNVRGTLTRTCKTSNRSIKYYISGIIAGMDAQVEVKARQWAFVENGTRLSQSLFMDWITMHEIKLANTLQKMGTQKSENISRLGTG